MLQVLTTLLLFGGIANDMGFFRTNPLCRRNAHVNKCEQKLVRVNIKQIRDLPILTYKRSSLIIEEHCCNTTTSTNNLYKKIVIACYRVLVMKRSN